MFDNSYSMLAVPTALEIVLEHAKPLAAVVVPVAQAVQHVLAADVAAADPLPPFPAAMKDGYAVVAADGPGVYPVVGEVTAGRVADFTVNAGSIAYVTTGAPLPRGADAVVMVEETEPQPGSAPLRIRIRTRVRPGAEVRPVGFDVQPGAVVLPAGTRLGPAEIGLLATVGLTQVAVHPRPRVAVLSTGDELLEPGVPLTPGQIWDSNRPMLLEAAAAAGADVIDLGIARDDPRHLAERLRAGLTAADVLVTSGGVSMGNLDLIKPLLAEAGTVHFGRLRMKPGKPCTFATVPADVADAAADLSGPVAVSRANRTRLAFGLPGNPVSSLVTFYLLVMPALRKLAGWRDPYLPRVQAVLAQPLTLDPERPEYHRAVLRWEGSLHAGRGGFLATSTGSQASSRLLSMRSANALLELPQAAGRLEAGAIVTALLIGSL
jgi:gephyrin